MLGSIFEQCQASGISVRVKGTFLEFGEPDVQVRFASLPWSFRVKKGRPGQKQRRRFRRRNNAALLIQRYWRSIRRKKQESLAAIRIQAWYRRTRLARTDLRSIATGQAPTRSRSKMCTLTCFTVPILIKFMLASMFRAPHAMALIENNRPESGQGCSSWSEECRNVCMGPLRQGKQMILGSFEVSEGTDGVGVIRAADPSYSVKPRNSNNYDYGFTVIVDNARTGSWIAGADFIQRGNGYKELLRLWARSKHAGMLLQPRMHKNVVGVDSGLAGIWDDVRMPSDTHASGFYGQLLDELMVRDENPGQVIHNPNHTHPLGVLGHGPGDGGYTACSHMDNTGLVARVWINFDGDSGWSDGSDTPNRDKAEL